MGARVQLQTVQNLCKRFRFYRNLPVIYVSIIHTSEMASLYFIAFETPFVWACLLFTIFRKYLRPAVTRVALAY